MMRILCTGMCTGAWLVVVLSLLVKVPVSPAAFHWAFLCTGMATATHLLHYARMYRDDHPEL